MQPDRKGRSNSFGRSGGGAGHSHCPPAGDYGPAGGGHRLDVDPAELFQGAPAICPVSACAPKDCAPHTSPTAAGSGRDPLFLGTIAPPGAAAFTKVLAAFGEIAAQVQAFQGQLEHNAIDGTEFRIEKYPKKKGPCRPLIFSLDVHAIGACCRSGRWRRRSWDRTSLLPTWPRGPVRPSVRRDLPPQP